MQVSNLYYINALPSLEDQASVIATFKFTFTNNMIKT